MKKILAIVLGLALAMSISTSAFAAEVENKTGSTSMIANIVAASMSITVPTDIVFMICADGTINYPENCYIQNNHGAPVKFTSASFTPSTGWTATDEVNPYADAMDENRVTIMFATNYISESGTEIDSVIEGNGTFDLELSVLIPGSRTTQNRVNIGTLTYNFDWYTASEE